LIATERLILRPRKDEDFLPYAEMNADPKVREFFPSVLTREESDTEVRRFRAIYERDGFCMFAAELIATGQFAGFIGLQTMTFLVPSRRVMEKIGMKHLEGLNFDHPRVPEGHPLRAHLLYALTKDMATSTPSQRDHRP
jgi:RimJ/RimL family protein N-acetyltransferase